MTALIYRPLLAIAVLAARPHMQPALVNNRTIFPQPADLQGSFVALTPDPKTINDYTRIWQQLRSGR